MKVTVNVDEGFLPRFSAEFRSRFGHESLFVRAVSDYFTMALARMLAAHGRLNNTQSVKFFGSEEAARAVSRLVAGNRELSHALMQSATGSKPPEFFERAFLEKRPEVALDAWLAALEANDFAECQRLCEEKT